MRILIIDDDEDSRVLLRLILEAGSCGEVAEVGSGAAARAAIATCGDGETPDVVLVNLRMPELSGIDFCRMLRDDPRHRDIPLIATGAQRDPETLAEIFAAGAIDFLGKPFERAEVLARVRNALRLKAEIDGRKAREAELEKLTAELDASLARLRADLGAAASVQRSLLPAQGATVAGVATAWRFEPCAEIGGDLLNLLPLGDGKLAFYVLDVAGHGVPAALLCVGLHRLLSTATAGGYVLDAGGAPRAPEAVAALLNRDFASTDDAAQYFTMVYGVLDVQRGVLEYVRAGHPAPILLEAGRAPQRLDEGDMPIGLFAEARFRRLRRQLEPGARLLVYTDGVTEAERDADGAQFGSDRLMEILSATRPKHHDEVAQGVLDAVRTWLAPRASADDVSLLLIEVH